MIILFCIVIILSIILIFVFIKIYLMKKSIREIQVSLNDILKSDTNNLLTINSSDKEIINLTKNLNFELKNLRQKELQYKNGNQELKQIITNISHDMRTPLTAISGYLDLLNDTNDKTIQNDYLKVINQKTDDLILLTEQLFNFSTTIDIGDKLKKDKFCVNEILEETLANFYGIFKSKNIVPEIYICSSKIYRYFNKNSIIRVFENILSNISKYSEGNFKVVLSDDGKITFLNLSSYLDSTTVQKIFDRYFTVENAKKSTGLGLSIAKQLVELNDGSISAKYQNGYLIIEMELCSF